MTAPKVTEYLTTHIDASEKTQSQITVEAGFQKSNVLSMLKSGATKLPIARIPALAKALDRPVEEMFRVVLGEYMPDVLAMTDEVYSREKLNKGEQEVIDRIRQHTGGKAFKPKNDDLVVIDDLATGWKK